MANTRFDWDTDKDAENQQKRDVSFSRAQYAFADPQRVIAKDIAHSQTEERFYCFGEVDSGVLTVRFSICSKGCSHCCSIDVYITSLEAAYIAENIGITADSTSPYSKNHFSPCPFLSKKKSCSIYKFRPFAERFLEEFERIAKLLVEHPASEHQRRKDEEHSR